MVLLHGVASSGKTEVYVKLIQEVIDRGQQVLYLLPEIALTTQMIERLRRFFGNDIGVYHSKFNSTERVEVWYAVLHAKSKEHTVPYKIILGARSSLFLPYNNLGLIIIDEEHDTSYKQHNSPRYHARDTALYMCRLYGCKALLGTATPAIETYYNTKTEKFNLVTLKERFGNLPTPEVEVVNIKDLAKKRAMKSIFSPAMLKGIEEALQKKEQVIVFQNRRGFALWLECQSCSYIPMCKYCDVTLTYHKNDNLLRCHYCGYTSKIPAECPSCKSGKIVLKSYGTQRVEDELKIFFPQLIIGRLDYDSTRSKTAFEDILTDFSDGKIQILVGTQMLSKGLNFENIGLVGIMNADNILNFPDFRSFERGFQVLTQVCGRSGRKYKQGKVVMQTFNPDHFVINSVLSNDYEGFYNQQIQERNKFIYPPFCRLILVSFKSRNMKLLNEASAFFAENMRYSLPKRVLGPEYPFVGKIKNEFIKNVLIKVDKKINVDSMRILLTKQINQIRNHNDFKSVKVIVDVDPV
ncbi:MAG: primosomal protein N' [Bacteroidales bacterium]|nr:primosomal protein N' [Bacteroidales bacterium]